MPIRNFVVLLPTLAVLLLAPHSVSAQVYPNKPIRMITSEPGGSSDLAARWISQGISVPLGQPVVVENRPGIIAVESAAKATPDGYTLLYYGGVIWLEPLVRDNVPWDAVRDFSPISLTARSPNILVVHPSLPVSSVKELIAYAKARPGELNYSSSGGAGATVHLAAELFKSMAGVNIVRVNYKGGGLAMTALVGNEVQLAFPTAGSVISTVKAGKLRALAVTSAQPSPLAPGLPTVSASGVAGYESLSVLGIFAPAKTPPLIINRLNQEIVRVLQGEEIKQRLFNGGNEAVGSTPAQFAATVKAEIAKWGKLIKERGIREQ